MRLLGYADRYRHVLAHIFGLKALNFADIGKIMGSVEAMEKDYVSDDWPAATSLIQTELFCLGTVFCSTALFAVIREESASGEVVGFDIRRHLQPLKEQRSKL